MSHVSLFVTLQSPDPSLHPAAAQSSVSQAPGSGHFSAGDGNTSVADKLADTQHAAAAVTELSAVHCSVVLTVNCQKETFAGSFMQGVLKCCESLR